MTGSRLTRPFVLAALITVAVAFPAASETNRACAGDGGRAALVVDTGADVHTFCIALPDGAVDGLELIALASQQHGLSYRLGFGGEAVCMLADVGASGDDCWEHYPDFWGYWRGDGSGGWIWSGTGAGSATVEDGDVEGWAWGSGGDGDSHPSPPATTFSSVCVTAAASRRGSDRSSQRGSAGSAGGSGETAPRSPSASGSKTARPGPPATARANNDGDPAAQDHARAGKGRGHRARAVAPAVPDGPAEVTVSPPDGGAEVAADGAPSTGPPQRASWRSVRR